MSFYLPIALLFGVLLSFLCYYAYGKEWPALILWSGLLMLVVLRVMTSLYPYIWNTDEAEWVLLARTLPDCAVPYKCFDPHSTGFLNILMFKPLDWLGVRYTYSSLRLFGLFVYIVPSALLFYYTLRRMYPARIVVVGMTLLFHYHLFGSHCYDLFSYHSEQVLMLLTAAIFYCYVRYKRDNKFIHLVLASLCIGLMPFFKLQSGPLVIGFTILFFIHFLKNRKFVQGIIFCVVGVAPLALIVLYFWKSGLLNDFWKAYIVSNQYLVKNYAQSGFVGRSRTFFYQLRWEIPYYLLILLLLVLTNWRKKLTWATISQFDFAAFLLLCCAYLAFGAPGIGMQHYLTLVTIPFLLVITNILFLLDIEEFMERKGRRVLFAGYLTLVAFFLLLLPELPLFRYRAYHERRPDSENLVKYVEGEVPAGKPVCVLGWYDAVEIQVSLDRPLATKTAHTYYLLADKDPGLMHYYQQQYIDDLESSRPSLVIDPLRMVGWFGGTFREMDDPRMEPVRRYLEEKYTRQESMIDGCVIYKRKHP